MGGTAYCAASSGSASAKPLHVSGEEGEGAPITPAPAEFATLSHASQPPPAPAPVVSAQNNLPPSPIPPAASRSCPLTHQKCREAPRRAAAAHRPGSRPAPSGCGLQAQQDDKRQTGMEKTQRCQGGRQPACPLLQTAAQNQAPPLQLTPGEEGFGDAHQAAPQALRQAVGLPRRQTACSSSRQGGHVCGCCCELTVTQGCSCRIA